MKIVVFWEDDFPFIDVVPMTKDDLRRGLQAGGQAAFVSAAKLPAALEATPDLLVTPYGSAFPKPCWQAFTAFLRRGGNWLNLGGAPAARPVRRKDAGWQVEVAQTSYGKEIMIRHTYRISLPPDAKLTLPVADVQDDRLLGMRPGDAWSLQVLLTDNRMIAGECGSGGTRNAVLRPLVQAVEPASGHVLAAPVVAIEQMHGPFIGGRWVLACCHAQEPFPAEFIAALCEYALRPHVLLEVRPGFACYYPAEKATVIIRASCPHDTRLSVNVTVTEAETGSEIYARNFALMPGAADAFVSTPPIAAEESGLHIIRAIAEVAGLLDQQRARAVPRRSPGRRATRRPAAADDDVILPGHGDVTGGFVIA